jgi:pimeloyl-ACP methyl ester carboxylesterase
VVLDLLPVDVVWELADHRMALGFWPWSLLAQPAPLPERLLDASDRAAGRRIRCPVLALWSGTGPLGSWYDDSGGPLALWRGLADDVTGGPVEGGHFFPEEHPRQTADTLRRFLG